MIDTAEGAGADAIKFQSFVAEESVRKEERKADYQEENTKTEESQYEMLKRYELSQEDHYELLKYCEGKGIEFMTTVSSRASLDLIQGMDIPILKIGSSDITNHPLLSSTADLGKPMIVSTGMSYMQEVNDAFEVIRNQNAKVNLAFLHCVSDYPADNDTVNLKAIRTMGQNLPVQIGYSDHTMNPETPAIAVSSGATIIEKHFTLDRSLEGPDQEASLEPAELKKSVSLSRLAYRMLGDGTKCPTEAESENRRKVRRSIHASNKLESGDKITEDDIKICRPNDGISPVDFDTVVGSTVTSSIDENNPIQKYHLQ
ncbi:Sialic acid synthase [Halanaeroarchaeum sp. HSR-CO]|nr:Sialic acid synthase [Halanaeroarchaeum sp. HSR-CO]